MKRYGCGCLVVVAFMAFCFLLGLIPLVEMPFLLFFGWIVFLVRTIPEMTIEPAAFIVAGAALAAAVAVGHWLGRWLWQARAGAADTPTRPWRFHWTARIACLVVLAFAAGIGLLGTVHEVAWYFSSDETTIEMPMRAMHRMQSMNNLKQIGLGMESYQAKHGRFPPGGTFDPYGEGLHSWETLLLPYLEIPDRPKPNLQLPWNHPQNTAFFMREIQVFRNPAIGRHAADLLDSHGYALSHYSLNSHVARANFGIRREDVTDGLANTLMAGEVNSNFKPWGHPVNWRDPTLGINRSPDGFGGGKGYRGATFLMMDGSARFISEMIDPEVLKALSTPAGGEPLGNIMNN
jgi:hypothetical protein